MKKFFLYFNEEYIGELYFDSVRGEEISSFRYASDYLTSSKPFQIDPELPLFSERQYASKGIFSFLSDMIPDRFGKLLIEKEEIEKAKLENRPLKKLQTSDYLERLSDVSRMGALRIKRDMNKEFITCSNNPIPPYIYLRDIEDASIKIESDIKIDEKIYERLLVPGSSLGGARPKANIYYDNDIYIAKFPSRNDDYDIESLEYLALSIAKKCGIDVPDIKLEKYSKYGSTLLIKRFDRNKTDRIHFISAVTALGAKDGENSEYSYLDLLSFIKTQTSNIVVESNELYKRVVFNYIINNTDNHLRNHAFIHKDGYYKLSPIFDVNPSLYVSNFSLGIKPNGLMSKDEIIDASRFFDIEREAALEIYQTIFTIIREEIENSKIQNEFKSRLLKIIETRK